MTTNNNNDIIINIDIEPEFGQNTKKSQGQSMVCAVIKVFGIIMIGMMVLFDTINYYQSGQSKQVGEGRNILAVDKTEAMLRRDFLDMYANGKDRDGKKTLDKEAFRENFAKYQFEGTSEDNFMTLFDAHARKGADDIDKIYVDDFMKICKEGLAMTKQGKDYKLEINDLEWEQLCERMNKEFDERLDRGLMKNQEEREKNLTMMQQKGRNGVEADEEEKRQKNESMIMVESYNYFKKKSFGKFSGGLKRDENVMVGGRLMTKHGFQKFVQAFAQARFKSHEQQQQQRQRWMELFGERQVDDAIPFNKFDYICDMMILNRFGK